MDNEENTIRTGAGTLVINPGSGAVPDATLTHAEENIKHFVADIDVDGIEVLRNPKDDERGRFGFMLWRRGSGYRIDACTVQMPGIPLHQVRFMQEPGQDIWDFPRLYIDDSSWIWCFAITCALESLSGQVG